MKIQSRVKFWIAVLLIVLVSIIPSVAFANLEHSTDLSESQITSFSRVAKAAEQAIGVVNTGALNVRSGPGPNFNVVTVVYSGQTVSVLGRYSGNSWVKVRLYSGTEGWVNSFYLNMNVPLSQISIIDTPAPPTTPTPTPPVSAIAVVTTGALNLRSGPDPAYNVVGVAYSGEVLQLLGRNNAGSWLFVKKSSGVEGWVNGSYVSPSVPISSLPVKSTTPPTATATVITSAANVRNGPGAQYNSIATLYYGQVVTPIGRVADSTWIQVRLGNGVVGWMSNSTVQVNVPSTSLPIVGEVPPPANAAIVNIGALNVRYGPSVSFGAFAVVYRGQTVTMIGRAPSNTWVQVRIPSGAIGWVNSNYLISNTPILNLPIIW